ncbi:MAG: glycosyltransferase family 2 protein [Nitrospirae bacterium]|nr:glycosyltransferase family 2 protein [Nitrospirota bacterium]
MKLGQKVSIVIPAMNEEENLPMVLGKVNQFRERMGEYEFEVIVVDDHSIDNTYDVARENGVLVFRNEYRAGKGNALRYGFERATGDYIVMLDADCSHNPLDIPAFLEKLEEGAGLVIGSRIYGGSDEYTRIRAFGNIMLTLIFGLLHGRYLSDALNGFKAFRKDVFSDFRYTSSNFEIEIELLVNTLRKGYQIVEVPSHEGARMAGEAKSKVVKHGTKFLLRIIKERFRGGSAKKDL